MSTLIHFVAFQDTESKLEKQKQQQVQNTTSTVITTVTVSGTTTIYSDYEGWDEQPTRVHKNTETLNQLKCCSENTVALLT